jgi:hypothetical protein
MKKSFLFSAQFHKAFAAISGCVTLPAIHKVAVAKMKLKFAAEEKIVGEIRDGLIVHHAEKHPDGSPVCKHTEAGLEYTVSEENRRKLDADLKPVMEEEFFFKPLMLEDIVNLPTVDGDVIATLLEAGVIVEGNDQCEGN